MISVDRSGGVFSFDGFGKTQLSHYGWRSTRRAHAERAGKLVDGDMTEAGSAGKIVDGG